MASSSPWLLWQSLRLRRLCEHLDLAKNGSELAPSKTEGGGTDVDSAVMDILEDLGKYPITPKATVLYYMEDSDLPPYDDRGGMYDAELVAKIQKLGEKDPKPGQDPVIDNLQAAKVFLLYGAGALDEARNLVMKLVKPDKASLASKDCLYALALIHRNEGDYSATIRPGNLKGPQASSAWEKEDEDIPDRDKGERSTGWDKALKFFKESGDTHEIHSTLLEAANKIAEGKPGIQAELKKAHEKGWNAAAFIKYCREAEKLTSSFAYNDSPDHRKAINEVKGFIEQVINAEWRLAVDHVLGKAKLTASTTKLKF